MRIYALIAFALFCQSAIAQTNLLFEEIPHNLYMNALVECKECASYMIIITDKKVNKHIASAFKSIANSFNNKLAGAIVNWKDALTNYRFFKNNRCGSFTDLAESVVVYIDKKNSYCESFAYDNQPQLVGMISIISSNLGELKNIKNETWRLRTKQAIASYAKENKIAAASKQTAFKFIDYIGNLLLEHGKK